MEKSRMAPYKSMSQNDRTDAIGELWSKLGPEEKEVYKRMALHWNEKGKNEPSRETASGSAPQSRGNQPNANNGRGLLNSRGQSIAEEIRLENEAKAYKQRMKNEVTKIIDDAATNGGNFRKLALAIISTNILVICCSFQQNNLPLDFNIAFLFDINRHLAGWDCDGKVLPTWWNHWSISHGDYSWKVAGQLSLWRENKIWKSAQIFAAKRWRKRQERLRRHSWRNAEVFLTYRENTDPLHSRGRSAIRFKSCEENFLWMQWRIVGGLRHNPRLFGRSAPLLFVRKMQRNRKYRKRRTKYLNLHDSLDSRCN